MNHVDHASRIVGIIVLLAGPCALAFLVVSWFRAVRFIRRRVEASGKVVRLDLPIVDGRLPINDYVPVFTFVAADGEAYTVTSPISSSHPVFKVGDTVKVLYDPTNPNGARIYVFWRVWGAVVLSGITALIFFGVGFKLLGFLMHR